MISFCWARRAGLWRPPHTRESFFVQLRAASPLFFYSAPNQASPQGCTIYRRRVLKERFNFPTADSHMRQGPELLRTGPMPFGAGAKPFCRLDKSTGSLLKDRTGIVRKS
jgi:hypothetical protein